MTIRLESKLEQVNIHDVCSVIKEAGLATYSQELTKKAFENSYLTLFLFDDTKLIGTVRVLSVGAYQAGIYDLAILPQYQNQGLGKLLLQEIHERLDGMQVILYAKPEAIGFYKKCGYAKLLTGMAKFTNEVKMREKQFIE
jgi:ribosomal protein S18 acetylase RimI-like enzyme